MPHPDFLERQRERTQRIEFCRQLKHYFKMMPSSLTVALPIMMPSSSSPLHEVSGSQFLKRLSTEEIAALEKNQCSCDNWTDIIIVTEANRDHWQQLARLIHNTRFADTVILILNNRSDLDDDDYTRKNLCPSWVEKLPMGLHNNLLVSNCIVDLRARVHRNTALCHTYIGPFTTVINCGSIDWSNQSTTTHSLGQMTITVGAEKGGGRQIAVHPEVDMPHVMQQLEASCSSFYSSHNTTTHSSDSSKIAMNVIDHHAFIRDTPTLDSIYLHPHASIQAATSVMNAILLPAAHIASGSTVNHVMLQWNASIVEQSSVTNTLLMEEAHVGPHSLVVNTLLGPDVHVSAGELHASVVGPNTNAHHQSLLIGCLWPLGRGNVGYGANVGSNHTGRLPDQECTAGEGIFWGLSTVVKFPVDLTSAPYTLIAAGTTLSPQRVTMPFSLIVSNSKHVDNDILPGWLLRSSPYTLARNEVKYATRRKAARHLEYTGWKIIRAETVMLCWHARRCLLQSAQQQDYYTEKEIYGLGNNRLSEKGRLAGIEAYTACIQMFALRGLWEFIEDSGMQRSSFVVWDTELESAAWAPPERNGVEWPHCPWEEESVDEWSVQKFLLRTEFPLEDAVTEDAWLVTHLRTLIQLEHDYSNRVYESKRRDDKRGVQVIPGYEESHDSAQDDTTIVDVTIHANQVEVAILNWLNGNTISTM